MTRSDDPELEKRVEQLMSELDTLMEKHFPDSGPGRERAGEPRTPGIRELLREDVRQHIRKTLERTARAEVCDCTHDDTAHVREVGRCTSLDSYGTPCECPSFEKMEGE